LISSIFSQQTIAVLDFEGIGVSQEEARALSNRFGSEFLELAEYKFTLVERQAMGEILKEQGLQQSGCVSSECAVEVGAALGAELIIIGSISKVGTIFSVNARMLDVETSRILKSINYDQIGDIGLLLTKGMRQAAAKMLDVGVKPAAPLTGKVSFTSEYQGVDIFVNEEQIGSVPLLKNYTVGVYEFSASKLNYETYEGEFEIRTNETTDVFIRLKPKVTSLKVKGEDGIELFMQNKSLGLIENGLLMIDSLRIGIHVITGRRAGYEVNTITVDIHSILIEYEEDIILEKIIVNLVFTNANPNQSIYIKKKDKDIGNTYNYKNSSSIKLEEGDYTIRIDENGFLSHNDEITIKATISRQQSYLIPNLKQIEVPVSFNISPHNAILRHTITGIEYGSLEYLTYGNYKIVATAPKYQSKNVSVLVNKPESQTFQIDLEPKKRIKALTYSSLLPGSGQFYAENKTKSAIFFLASAGLSAMLYNNYDTYNVEEPLVSQYKENYLNATNPDEIDQNLNTYQSQVNTVNDLQTQMLIYGGALAVTWVVNIIDAFLFSGLLE